MLHTNETVQRSLAHSCGQDLFRQREGNLFLKMHVLWKYSGIIAFQITKHFPYSYTVYLLLPKKPLSFFWKDLIQVGSIKLKEVHIRADIMEPGLFLTLKDALGCMPGFCVELLHFEH